jgi:DNA-binding transcriptional ArsR family regulator
MNAHRYQISYKREFNYRVGPEPYRGPAAFSGKAAFRLARTSAAPPPALLSYVSSCIYTKVQVDVFQTLADPMRRRIVELLADDEHAVNDLVALVGIHQSGVSRHLRILHEAGFVTVRPDGARRLYSLRPERFVELNEWLGQYRELWEQRLDRFDLALQHAQKEKR